MILLGFSSRRPLPERQWAVACMRATHLHTSIFMSATAERAMGGGFQRNSVSELKLKNRRTGSTLGPTPMNSGTPADWPVTQTIQ